MIVNLQMHAIMHVFFVKSNNERKTSNLDFKTYEDYIHSCYKEGVEEVMIIFNW